GQLITAMRQADNSLAIAELAIRHREKGAESGVVGFDIAGPENGFPPSAHLSAFNALHQAYVPVTIHAGEAAGKESIHEAITICHAQRLGHGARIVEDMDIVDGEGQLGSLAAWVLDQQIPLELCPSSNLQTDIGGTIATHPITGLKDLGFAGTVNPDNRLMSGTSMTRGMRRLAGEAGRTQADLEWASGHAATAALRPLGAPERRLDEILIPGFARVTICPTMRRRPRCPPPGRCCWSSSSSASRPWPWWERPCRSSSPPSAPVSWSPRCSDWP